MDYIQMEQVLLNLFSKNNFQGLVRQKKYNTCSSPLAAVHSSLPLRVCFPGYKSILTEERTVYDYRVEVDLAGTGDWVAVSHVNIILDLFSKVWFDKSKEPVLYRWLCSLAENGCGIDLITFDSLTLFPNRRLPSEFYQKVNKMHQSIGKIYHAEGNARSFTAAELSDIIPWIALQEDINYPMPKFQGRRMPFCRYMEAIYCAAHPGDRKISHVISRALSHKKIAPWADAQEIPYRSIQNIASGL